MSDTKHSAARNITVGFIGLGSQGAPMARRIDAAGYPLLLWARRPEALVPFGDTHAELVSSIAELGARAEQVGVCVVDDAGVRDVVGALLPHMRAGSRIAIHSTIHPETCRALARQAAERHIALIDAPVSGGAPAATAGTLTVMIGGEAAAVAAALPVFQTFGSTLAHLGGVGAGQLAKLVNNSLMAANMALADAALHAGATLGLDPAALSALVQVSSGRSYAFDVRARLPNIGLFAHGAKLLAKDVGLLAALLKDDPGCAVLRDAAEPFLERIARAQVQGDST
jgi:3-hydroxyisobutyrate dehydrogenase-like beta-hydroxyacid dehydrogenase